MGDDYSITLIYDANNPYAEERVDILRRALENLGVEFGKAILEEDQVEPCIEVRIEGKAFSYNVVNFIDKEEGLKEFEEKVELVQRRKPQTERVNIFLPAEQRYLEVEKVIR